MFFSRILIYFCLIALSAGTDEINSSIHVTLLDTSFDEISISAGNDTVIDQVTGSSENETSDNSINSSTIIDKETSNIGTDHDIEITGTATPPSDEIDNFGTSPGHYRTTNFDDISNISEITVTETKDVVTACSLNPCRNGGTCVEDIIVPSLFSCICPNGYVGIRCGTVDKCLADDEEQLCKNGACVYSEDGLLRTCQCYDGMYWNETGKECRDPDPPCFPNPCMNGGICSNKYGMPHCDCPPSYIGKNCSVLFTCGNCGNGTCTLNNEQTVKFCICNEGFYWNNELQTCKVIESPCDSSPCQNGGVCEGVSETNYNCSCLDGFSGNSCEITNKCNEDSDCVQGTCILSDDKKLKRCNCGKGFYLEEESHTCKEITNSCQPNPCLNDGICTIVSSDSYNCTCGQGYFGKNCDVRDLCEMDGGNTFCGDGICINNNKHRLYFCTCRKGEYFQYSQRKCAELDMCPLMKCEDTTEVCKMGECTCKEDYKYDNVTKRCKPDFCSSNPCPLKEMICEEGKGKTDYKCFCPEGFAFNGTHCNEASCTFPNFNPCSQFCSKTENEYECSCAKDFELQEDNHTCAYAGNNTCSNKTCDHGFCVKENDMELCICPPGFTEIDGACKDICSSDMLAPGICPSNQCETSNEGGFKCKCEGKFALSKDKTTCTVRNVCEENETGWKTCKERNAECVTDWLSLNGYRCVCAIGQIATEGGICRDICSLENNLRHCSLMNAVCDADNNGKICKCPPYFKENERDGKCTRPAEFSYLITLPLDKSTYLAGKREKRSFDSTVDYKKVLSDVTVTVQEMFTSFSQANVLSCKIISEYILCKIELQFTTASESELKRLKLEDICLGNGISNVCLLPPSLVLAKNRIRENVDIQLTNPCDKDIKNFVCGMETTCVSSLSQKSFNCSCKPGYFARKRTYPFGDTRSFIETCSDIDECAVGNPCPSNSDCKNTIGSYSCSCKPGYRGIQDVVGLDTQKCVEICRPNPCMHGHCSRRGDHEFDCRCDAGYAGTFCNLQDENFKRAKITTIIVGVVLGGALLITFILFAACISRLRKKKIIENSTHIIYSGTEMTDRRRGEGGAINNAFQRE